MFLIGRLKKTLFFITIGILMPLTLTHASYCGDGGLNEIFGEQCDDGNFINRDGCSAYCEIEDMEPPSVASISIPNDSTGISTLTSGLTVVFSEPIQESSLIKNSTIRFEHSARPLEFELELRADQKTLIIHFGQELYSEAGHALRIKNILDIPGNLMEEEHISTFQTAISIDYTAPTVDVNPPGGVYSFFQNVELTPYINDYTGSDEFIDETATVYYTLDGTNPTKNSLVSDGSIPVRTNLILKYFAIDGVGNQTDVMTENYSFGCPEHPNAKEVSPYPNCTVAECKNGFVLKSNICVARLGAADPDDYKANAVTAPLFSSDTPMTISTKPAILVTKQHRGILPRPIIFKDLERGIVIEFERDTEIRTLDGKVFDGYILPPENLYLKDFPINFGYSFKSIFEFKAGDGRRLKFDPPYKITAPYTDGFNGDESVTIFTFDAENEIYSEYDKKLYSVDLAKKELTIMANETIAFFIAQRGKNFNKSVFRDVTDHWAKNYIEALYRKGIVKGRSSGIYAPDDFLPRAEFLKIALEAIGAETQDIDSILDPPYRDVPVYAWYVTYVKRAKELGLIRGYANRQFKPEQFINRAEAVKILISAFKFDLDYRLPDAADVSGRRYNDLVEGQWYYPYARFVIENEIMKGIQRNRNLYSFDPASPITRAEMAKLAIKTIELYEAMEK